MGLQRVGHDLVTEQQQMNNVLSENPVLKPGTPMYKKMDTARATLANPITQAFFKPKTQWPEQVTCLVRLAGLYFHSSCCEFSESITAVDVINLPQVMKYSSTNWFTGLH